MARLRAIIRNSFGMTDNTITVADLTMDCAAHTVTRAGQEISLSAKEYALLEYLLQNKGIVLSREKIEDHIWDFDYEGGDPRDSATERYRPVLPWEGWKGEVRAHQRVGDYTAM